MMENRTPEPIHLTLKDEFGFERSWIKTEDETLGSMATSYAKYSDLKEEDFFFLLRTVPISTFEPIKKLPLMNGDIIKVIVNIAKLVPCHDGKWISTIISLSPKDHNGMPYNHYSGPATRPDERTLRVLLSFIWPGVPPIAIDCRARKNRTLNDVLLVFRQALSRSTIEWEDTGFDDSPPLSQVVGNSSPLTLRISEHPTTTFNDALKNMYTIEEAELRTDPICWIVTGIHATTSEKKEISINMVSDTSVEDLHDWLRGKFGIKDTTSHLLHGLRTINNGTVADNGFRIGQDYEVTIAPGPAPFWATGLLPPERPDTPDLSDLEESPSPTPRASSPFEGEPNHYYLEDDLKDLKRLTHTPGMTLSEVLIEHGYQNLRELRILHDGVKIHLDDDLSDLPSGSKLEVLREQIGGGGRGRRGTAPRSEVYDGLSQNDNLYRGRTNSIIMGKTVGKQHGILRGRIDQLPEPEQGHVRLQLQGRVIGLWAIIIGPATPLNLLTEQLEDTYERKFVYTLAGPALDTTSTPSQLSLSDGQTIDVGGANHVPPPNALDDPDALRYIIKGTLKELPPPLP
ncbi:hypothetical protein CF326_g9418, partial [Tilletia indica]